MNFPLTLHWSFKTEFTDLANGQIYWTSRRVTKIIRLTCNWVKYCIFPLQLTNTFVTFSRDIALYRGDGLFVRWTVIFGWFFLRTKYFLHSFLKFVVLNSIDKGIYNWIQANHVHCKTVKYTCKTKEKCHFGTTQDVWCMY